jgi:hypothetical protein
MKGGEQFAGAARIVFRKFARVEAGVSDDASIRGQLRILKRSEKPGCTAADDC